MFTFGVIKHDDIKAFTAVLLIDYQLFMHFHSQCVFANDFPTHFQVMMQILKDMGITEYEPRVINQMLEFTYSKRL